MDASTGSWRVMVHGGFAMLVVLLLAASWPAMASTGIAWAPPAARGWLDAVLVFAPLMWAPLPAMLVWIGVEGAGSGATAES